MKALVVRVALAAAVALTAGAAGACKKEPEAAKATAGETGRASASSAGGAGAELEGDTVDRTAKLPAMPRKLPGMEDRAAATDEPRRRRGPWGDGPRPDRAEMKAKRDERRKQALEMYDGDKNGELDDDERALMHEARVADMVARMDQNADGKLTREELEASASNRRRPPPDFDAIDTDKDGFVSVEEMAAMRRPMRGRGMPPAP